MFKPTHIYHFGDLSANNKLMFPKGVPVKMSGHAHNEDTLWVSDSENNTAGWANPNGCKNFAGSYVVEI